MLPVPAVVHGHRIIGRAPQSPATQQPMSCGLPWTGPLLFSEVRADGAHRERATGYEPAKCVGQRLCTGASERFCVHIAMPRDIY